MTFYPGAGVAAGHRISDGLQVQIRAEPAARAAAGRQSHRLRSVRAQAPHPRQADTQFPEVIISDHLAGSSGLSFTKTLVYLRSVFHYQVAVILARFVDAFICLS
jgi:hypothetical protein